MFTRLDAPLVALLSFAFAAHGHNGAEEAQPPARPRFLPSLSDVEVLLSFPTRAHAALRAARNKEPPQWATSLSKAVLGERMQLDDTLDLSPLQRR